MSLSTAGHKLNIVLNATEQKNVKLTEESLDNFRVNNRTSAKEIQKFTNFVRANFGKNSVPAHYREHVSQKSKLLENLYRGDIKNFDCDDSGKMKLRPVVFADSEELLDTLLDLRKIIGKFFVKVQMDGGQGFLKLCLTLWPDDDISRHDFENEQSDNDSVSAEGRTERKKRTSYAEGGLMSKKPKLTSAKRIILLAIVPDAKETYANVKLLFELSNLNNIPFKFVADFKLLLIINGQQTASAMYPCPYCFVSLKDLRNTEESDLVEQNNAAASSSANIEINSSKRLKTYGDLRKDFEKFCATGRNKKYAKDCHSTIHPPLFEENDHVTVLEKCIIPELHILQGFVNHLFFRGLVPLVGQEKALLWPKKLSVISKGYHGGCFEGNACRKLLKEADKLNDPEIYEAVGFFKMLPFIAAFKAMNKVVDCCFIAGKVGDLLDKYMYELRKALDAVKYIDDVSESLKLHVWREHIEKGLTFIENNEGYGKWSDQGGESIHREFLVIWNRYKINDIDSESYLPQLLKAVVEFSSLSV